MKLRTLSLALALALLGCNSPAPNAPAPAASAATVTAYGYLRPTGQDGRLLYMASVTPWTTADINHVVLTLRNGDSTVTTTTVTQADLARRVSFSNLKQNTSYTLLAQAYKDASGTVEIDDAQSVAADCTTSFSTTRNPNVAIGNIVLRLADKTYSGTTEGASLVVTNGQVVDTESGEASALAPWQATVLAGSGAFGYADGSGSDAVFAIPDGIAVDASGNVYVADSFYNRIRKISPEGVVTTLAGSGEAGSADGTGSEASFFIPRGLAVDTSGNVYVADTYNNEIRKITSDGVVTTLAGSTTAGTVDGNGSEARFNAPSGVAVDANGNVYVADQSSCEIRKISPTGDVTTLAGSTTPGSADGNGTDARFNYPADVALDANGNLYVADQNNDEIRKISRTGDVTTLAGSTTAGSADGNGSEAGFLTPNSLAMDPYGNLIVADGGNGAIREITAAGVVTTLGSGFASPQGVAVDGNGVVYIADTNNEQIKKGH
ncbi:MAG TPA: NHL repeat-containing protein [Oscillatoriaceae cyanobacterium]